MYRLLTSVVMLFMALRTALALPLSSRNETAVDIDKRVTHKGRGTWFHPGRGHCGGIQKDSDLIAAMASSFYNQNNGGNCGQWIRIVNTDNGKSTYAVIRDSCESCNYNDIDMSPAVFSKLATLGTGLVPISWNFMPKGWHQ